MGYHVVNYIPEQADGFPKPAPSGYNFNVYLVHVFAYDPEVGPQGCFSNFFTGTKPMQAVYRSVDMEELQTCYRRRAMPWFSISAATEIFVDHLTENNMVVLNVHGGPEFTYLGLVWSMTYRLARMTIVSN